MRPLVVVILLVLSASCAPPSPRPAETSPTPDVQLGRPAATPPPSTSPTPPPLPTLATAPRDAVLALTDLPPGFGLAEERNDSWDVICSFQCQYVDGWLNFYSRTAAAGIVFVSSEATTWTSADAAKKATAQLLTYTVQKQQWSIEIPLGQTIGDESYGIRYGVNTSGGQTEYAVLFRAANVTNYVFIRGVTGTVDVSTAVELAKKQLARLRV